jgi:hypothetical protein
VKVTEDLLLFNGKVTVLVVLEFENTFDLVDHSLF